MTVSFGHKLAGLALGAAATIALPSSASAVSYNITSWGVDQTVSATTDPLWGAIQYQNASNQTVSENAWVGRLFLTGTNMTTNATETLLTWCIDVFDNLQNGVFKTQSFYTLTTPTYSSDRLQNVEKLIKNINQGGLGEITTDIKSAAAQLAIWEILNESSSNSWDVSSGSFSASGGTLGAVNAVGGVYSTANAWLANVQNGTFGNLADQAIVMLNPNDPATYVQGANSRASNQAQIYVVSVPVPEPASWMTMILGFGAIGTALRRRRAVGRAVA